MRVFVNAVDDPANASVYLGGVVRRGGVTLGDFHGGRCARRWPGCCARRSMRCCRRICDEWSVRARELRQSGGAATVYRWRRAVRELLEALNPLQARHRGSRDRPRDGTIGQPRRCRGKPAMTGRVSLVGAGPGDPGLLTLKAVRRLGEADLVLYDALVDDRSAAARDAGAALLRRQARRPPGAFARTRSTALMIRAARRGQRVVRLKGGDPFVFGRGGEEALALRAAGIPFEVVPGITSAIAAPPLAGIPVTHRGLAAAFLVVSGHDEEAFGAGHAVARARQRHASSC